MSVTLPAVSTVNVGWSMGFASDNGKGMTITTTSGSIISGGKSVGSITMGAGNYEYVRLQSDGNNFRIVSSTRNTRLANGSNRRLGRAIGCSPPVPAMPRTSATTATSYRATIAPQV
jgi:hypothetical protein